MFFHWYNGINQTCQGGSWDDCAHFHLDEHMSTPTSHSSSRWSRPNSSNSSVSKITACKRAFKKKNTDSAIRNLLFQYRNCFFWHQNLLKSRNNTTLIHMSLLFNPYLDMILDAYPIPSRILHLMFWKMYTSTEKTALGPNPKIRQKKKKNRPTWRIIPLSKWLITMVSKSLTWGYSPSKSPKWLINRGY